MKQMQKMAMIGLTAAVLCACGEANQEPAAVEGQATAAPATTGKGDVAGGDTAPRIAKHPIVLVHAFHATDSNKWSMERVRDALAADGHFVVLANLPPYAGTPERAAELVLQLDTARVDYCQQRRPEVELFTCLDATKVHLIGHSQGGLDARYAVSRLGYGSSTFSVTTLGTPHRGTPLGDLGLRLLLDPRVDGPIDEELRGSMTSFLENLLDRLRPDGLADAFYWLSEARFEASMRPDAPEAMPDVPTVIYRSWAGVATDSGELPEVSACSGLGVFPRDRAGEFHGLADFKRFDVISSVFRERHHFPNDGHIPVMSAQHGEFWGCLPTDHLDLVAQPPGQDDDRAAIGFDHESFFGDLGESLVVAEDLTTSSSSAD